ncbi:MAG: hypothetical protein EA402_12815 [Planctomycetota bacterium]|nr:MAG: hypothetical protein EA402_12815 [Planctomycetota bacterium]
MSKERVDFFMNTEFNQGPEGLTLISIGMVDASGNEFYAVSNAFHPEECNRYVQRKVLPRLGSSPPISPDEIKLGIAQFIGKTRPAFWGYCPSFDWVLISTLWQGLGNLPSKWPKYSLCLRQLALDHNVPSSAMPPKPGKPHYALEDAHWCRECHGVLMNRLGRDQILPRRSDTDF